jgi:hypothetical protein
MLIAEDGNPYDLEDIQAKFLRCPHPYRQLFLARRLGKSATTRMDILHKTIFEPSLRALAVLPSWSQAQDWGGEMQDLIARSEHITPFFMKQNVTTMRLENNSRINLASAGRDGVTQLGRGARYLVFDEAQQIPDRTFGFLLPVMRGTPGQKWQVFAGTPLGKIGMFWEVYNDAFQYVETQGTREIEDILEKETDQKFVVFQRQTAYLDDSGEIIESGTRRINIDELAADRRKMSETDFLREYCLRWLDSIGEVFPKELVDAIMLTNEKPQFSSDEEVVIGVDLGKYRHNSVICVAERESGGNMRIIFIKSFPLGTEYKTVANYLLNNIPLNFPNIRKCVIDQTGVGEKFVEDVEREATFKVEGFNFAGGQKKVQLVENGLYHLERDKVKIIYNQSLYTEMLDYRREINEKTNRFLYGKSSGGSDDYVDAMLLCIEANRSTLGVVGDFNVVSIGKSIMNRFGGRSSIRQPQRVGIFR